MIIVYVLIPLAIATVAIGFFLFRGPGYKAQKLWVVGLLEDGVEYEVVYLYPSSLDLVDLRCPPGTSHTVVIQSLTPPILGERYLAKNRGGKRFELVLQ